MKHPILVLLLMAAFQLVARAQHAPVQSAADGLLAARHLIQRVLPPLADTFQVELIPAADDKDVFEIEANGGKITLRGNNGLSLAMAFNWYLRHEAHVNFDWQAAGPLRFQGALPLPKEKTRQVCAARERFFLNYCTYGYTMGSMAAFHRLDGDERHQPATAAMRSGSRLAGSLEIFWSD